MAVSGSPTPIQLAKALKQAIKLYGDRQTVTGIDIGYKWKTTGQGKNEIEQRHRDKKCVRIHVQKKRSLASLKASKQGAFAKSIAGVPVDVIAGYYKALPAKALSKSVNNLARNHQARFDPAQGGISVGRAYEESAGTLGMIAIYQRTGDPVFLSNWHVLVGPFGGKGDIVVQPGNLDDEGTANNRIGEVVKHVLDARGDAAIASLNGSRLAKNAQFGSGVTFEKVRNSILDETLTKSGRTTGVTRGRVDGEGIYYFNYPTPSGKTKRIGIEGFKLMPVKQGNPNKVEISSNGDSGAIWYQPTSNSAVGLHFAGETNPAPGAEHAIVCNLTSVFEALELRLPEEGELETRALEARTNYQTRKVIKMTPEETARAIIEAYKIGLKTRCEDHVAELQFSISDAVGFKESALESTLPIDHINWCAIRITDADNPSTYRPSNYYDGANGVHLWVRDALKIVNCVRAKYNVKYEKQEGASFHTRMLDEFAEFIDGRRQ